MWWVVSVLVQSLVDEDVGGDEANQSTNGAEADEGDLCETDLHVGGGVDAEGDGDGGEEGDDCDDVLGGHCFCLTVWCLACSSIVHNLVGVCKT